MQIFSSNELRREFHPRVGPGICSALVIVACLATGIVQAADQGPRHHAKGQYETITATYTAVEGDELIAIGERFEVPVESLKVQNKLTSDQVKVGQKLVIATDAPAGVVQITGVLGSPSATTTIPGNQLPPPDPKFGGVIKEKASESKAWWPPRIVPPKGAPNVLLIMTDDDGFGWSLTASGPADPLLEMLSPVNGEPKQIKVSIDGIDFVFAVEPPERSRRFLEHAVQVRGSSVTGD